MSVLAIPMNNPPHHLSRPTASDSNNPHLNSLQQFDQQATPPGFYFSLVQPLQQVYYGHAIYPTYTPPDHVSFHGRNSPQAMEMPNDDHENQAHCSISPLQSQWGNQAPKEAENLRRYLREENDWRNNYANQIMPIAKIISDYTGKSKDMSYRYLCKSGNEGIAKGPLSDDQDEVNVATAKLKLPLDSKKALGRRTQFLGRKISSFITQKYADYYKCIYEAARKKLDRYLTKEVADLLLNPDTFEEGANRIPYLGQWYKKRFFRGPIIYDTSDDNPFDATQRPRRDKLLDLNEVPSDDSDMEDTMGQLELSVGPPRGEREIIYSNPSSSSRVNREQEAFAANTRNKGKQVSKPRSRPKKSWLHDFKNRHVKLVDTVAKYSGLNPLSAERYLRNRGNPSMVDSLLSENEEVAKEAVQELGITASKVTSFQATMKRLANERLAHHRSIQVAQEEIPTAQESYTLEHMPPLPLVNSPTVEQYWHGYSFYPGGSSSQYH